MKSPFYIIEKTLIKLNKTLEFIIKEEYNISIIKHYMYKRVKHFIINSNKYIFVLMI